MEKRSGRQAYRNPDNRTIGRLLLSSSFIPPTITLAFFFDEPRAPIGKRRTYIRKERSLSWNPRLLALRRSFLFVRTLSFVLRPETSAFLCCPICKGTHHRHHCLPSLLPLVDGHIKLIGYSQSMASVSLDLLGWRASRLDFELGGPRLYRLDCRPTAA